MIEVASTFLRSMLLIILVLIKTLYKLELLSKLESLSEGLAYFKF